MDKVLACRSSETVSNCSKTDEGEEAPSDEIDRHANLLAHEIALSFDHILDHIFSYLDPPDLLTCRLVSHRFLKFAKAPLNKKLELRFEEYELEILDPVTKIMKSSGKTLEQLTIFLEQSLLSSSPDSNANLISFPCTSFHFFDVRIGEEGFQYFLNINGPNIRKLKVYSVNRYPSDNILLHHVSRLLTIQAPYIERLNFFFTNPRMEWQQEVPSEIQESINEKSLTRSNRSPLLKTDPEYQQIISKVKALPNKSGLKVLKINGVGMAKVLELVFQLSPKLQEVIIDDDYHMHLLHPVNRAHLLRRLEFAPKMDYCNSHMMTTMEKISKDSNFGLEKLLVTFDRVLPRCRTDIEFEKRLASVINGILQQSRDTLKSLSISSTSVLRGMKIPSNMKQMRKLTIYDNGERPDSKWTVFPGGFSLTNTFPKLTCVQLDFFPKSVQPNDFFEFLNCLDFQGNDDPTLSLSVNKVVLFSFCFDRFETEDGLITLPAFITQRVQKLFPNARIEAEA